MAIIALIVAIVIGLGIGGALVLNGGDDDDEVSTDRSTTTTEDEDEDEDEDDEDSTTTEEEDEDDEDTTPSTRTRRTLVERSTTTRREEPTTTTTAEVVETDLEAALGTELDPATLECLTAQIVADPALAVAIEAAGDPTSPEFALVLDALLGCGGRPQLQKSFLEGMASGGMDQATIDCVTNALNGLDDTQFGATMIGFANEDPAALQTISGCM